MHTRLGRGKLTAAHLDDPFDNRLSSSPGSLAGTNTSSRVAAETEVAETEITTFYVLGVAGFRDKEVASPGVGSVEREKKRAA